MNTQTDIRLSDKLTHEKFLHWARACRNDATEYRRMGWNEQARDCMRWARHWYYKARTA